MEIKDIIYTAGFFDGEGHIRYDLNIIKRPNCKVSISYSIRIRIVNTDSTVIKKLHKLWGGFVYARKTSKKRPKVMFDLIIVKKEDVRRFIELTYPYLVVKKSQVDKALESYKLAREEDYMLPYKCMAKEYYSTIEVANILRVSRKTVFQWARDGKIKAIKVGKNYVIPRSAILEKLGKTLGADKKAGIEKAINKALKDYEKTFRMLGKE